MPKQGHSDPKLFSYKGDLSKEWYVCIHHTCPTCRVRKPFQVRLGINYHHTVKEREAEGKAVIELVKECLKEGWNPHDGNLKQYLQKEQEPELTPGDDLLIDYSTMFFTEALTYALKQKKKNLKKRSLPELKSVHKFATAAAITIRLDKFCIADVKKVHVKNFWNRWHGIGRLPMIRKEKGKYSPPTLTINTKETSVLYG